MPTTDPAPAPDTTPAAPRAEPVIEPVMGLVHRPDAGTLASGRWEAPPWAFYGASGLVVVAAAVYLGLRSPALARAHRSRPGGRR